MMRTCPSALALALAAPAAAQLANNPMANKAVGLAPAGDTASQVAFAYADRDEDLTISWEKYCNRAIRLFGHVDANNESMLQLVELTPAEWHDTDRPSRAFRGDSRMQTIRTAAAILAAFSLTAPAVAETIRCESVNARERYCPANTSGGAHLSNQFSREGCCKGDTWAHDSNGTWVTGGCRAEIKTG